MREHTPWPQPPAPAPRPQTPEPVPRLWTPQTHTLSGLQFLGLVMPQKPRPVVLTLREAEAAGNTLDVDVQQQLLGESAGGDSFPDVPLPDVPLLDVPLPDVPLLDVPFPDVPLLDVPLPDVPLRDFPLPEARPDGSVGKEWTSPLVASGLESDSSLVSFLWCNLFILGTDYGTPGSVLFIWVRVVGLFVSFVLIYISQVLIILHVARFLDCSGCTFDLFIVLWYIAHAVFLQLLAW